MIGQLILIACAAALAAITFTLVVKHANRRGVGVLGRMINGRIYIIDTSVLTDSLFVPRDFPDDRARHLFRVEDRLLTGEFLLRHATVISSPSALVKITGV